MRNKDKKEGRTIEVTARSEKKLHVLVMVLSVLNILLTVNLYRISGDWIQLGAAIGWLVAVIYEYIVIRKMSTFA